ncbi:hypothetical protein FH063_002491 [Azospirillum argentinense]|uniref:Uncharacterized protein n=2 Tax=Azospirillum argentinense TaxID=2970906 RepID=A0A5B0KNP9_9PROT|nr:hypothetical protein FH063_002491 [Azospirillum argentinense]
MGQCDGWPSFSATPADDSLNFCTRWVALPSRLLSRLSSKLGADRPRPAERSMTVRTAEPFRIARPSPVEEAISLLSDQDSRTVKRVVRAIEMQRVLAWEADTLITTNLDTMLGALRPLLQEDRLPRLDTLSRLAFAPVEKLFDGSDDVRAWSVPRPWLRAIWVLARRREPSRLDGLANLYAKLVVNAEGSPDTDAVAQIAGQSQRVLADVLGDMAADREFLASHADVMGWATAIGYEDPAAHLADLLTRLHSAYVAHRTVGDAMGDTLLHLRNAMRRRYWREAPELDSALFEIGQAVSALKRGMSAGPLSRSPAAAYFVLLGRSSPQPWSLLDVVRRRTRIELCAEKPIDSCASADMVALVDDLVGDAETRAARTIRLLDVARTGGGDCTTALFAAAEAAVGLSKRVRGIEGSGFLDPRGVLQRRMNAVRDRVTPQVRSVVLPWLGTLAKSPLMCEGDLSSLTSAVHASAALRAFVDEMDGLQCRAAARRVINMILDMTRSEIEATAAAVRRAGMSSSSRGDAALVIAETLAPETGSELRKRLLAAKRASDRLLQNIPSASEFEGKHRLAMASPL